MNASTPADDFTLRTEVLDALPIIQHVTDLLVLDELLDVHVRARFKNATRAGALAVGDGDEPGPSPRPALRAR